MHTHTHTHTHTCRRDDDDAGHCADILPVSVDSVASNRRSLSEFHAGEGIVTRDTTVEPVEDTGFVHLRLIGIAIEGDDDECSPCVW